MATALRFTLRCSGSFFAPEAVALTLLDATGLPARLIRPEEFEAASKSPEIAKALQKLRFTRALQIHACFQQMALRLGTSIETHEAHWPDFDSAYAPRLHKSIFTTAH